MKKCLNPECGKMFEPNKQRPDQKFCCEKCSRRYRYLTIQKPNYKPKEKISFNDRKYSRTTIYLVHKWTIEGMHMVDVAQILNRSIYEVNKILKKPLTENERVRMQRFLR